MQETDIATAYEAMAAALPDSVAVIQGPRTRTWAEFDDRASRLAGAFRSAGLGPGSKVGLYLTNCIEYLEAFYAAFKIRAVPVNINYRYVEKELAYLLDDSEAEAIVYPTSLAGNVGAVVGDRGVKLLLQVGDARDELVAGATAYEEAVSRHDPEAPIERAIDDHLLMYTGGTTGLPKGVVYEVGNLVTELVNMVGPFIGGIGIETLDDLTRVAADARKNGTSLTTMILPPLMHGTATGIGVMTHATGGTVALMESASFDAEEALASTEAAQASVMAIVGDPFARPMLETLQEHRDAGTPIDLSSLKIIMSAGAMLSAGSKQQLLEHAPQALVLDTLSASEGAMGTAITTAGGGPETSAFTLRPGTRVLDEDDNDIEPGSGIAGRVAVPTNNPIGYYKDPEKTAATFPVIDGTRYSIPGDWAIVEADGSMRLMGRGNKCINTAGEKVFPEEVEEALKTHPAVLDALVFGVDDEKWGQRVEAVVSFRDGASADFDRLHDHVRADLAGYKVPKEIHVVEAVPRAPNGKADYEGAKALAGRH